MKNSTKPFYACPLTRAVRVMMLTLIFLDMWNRDGPMASLIFTHFTLKVPVHVDPGLKDCSCVKVCLFFSKFARSAGLCGRLKIARWSSWPFFTLKKVLCEYAIRFPTGSAVIEPWESLDLHTTFIITFTIFSSSRLAPKKKILTGSKVVVHRSRI